MLLQWVMRVVLVYLLLAQSSSLSALTANKVWFEFMPDGRYKVIVNYTLPEQREFRESYAIFASKKEAERFYWSLIRGADFYPSTPKDARFINPKLEPSPW